MKILRRIGFILALFIAFAATLLAVMYYNVSSKVQNPTEFFVNLPKHIQDFYGDMHFLYENYSNENVLYTVLFILLFLFIFSCTYYIFYFFTTRKDKQHRNLVQKAFSRYISPSVIQDIMARPESLVLGGKSAYITVYFLDIVDFSHLMAEYHPKKVVEYLNEYFSEMSDIILEHEGTIDKYEGDSIMAFWGAPKPQDEHAVYACRTALNHLEALKGLRKKWKKMGRPELFGKIGMASGDMIVGNIGSKGHFNYTVIGGAANAAAQIEKLNTVYGTSVLVMEKTYHRAKHDFEFREIDEVALKGYKKPIRIFELLAEKEQLSSAKAELVAKYHEALECLRNQDYKEARKAINHCLRIASDDKPSQLLKERIVELDKKTKKK